MLKRKRIRTRGKAGLSTVFKELHEGDKVALVRDLAYIAPFPKRMQGKTGRILGYRGKCCVVGVKDGNKEKKFIVSKIHLKKLK